MRPREHLHSRSKFMRAWLNKLRQRLRALFKRRALDRDLDDELAFHLAMREQQNRDLGISLAEARYAARRQFGNYTQIKERSREMWTFASFESFWQDVRYAIRMMRRSTFRGSFLLSAYSCQIGGGRRSALRRGKFRGRGFAARAWRDGRRARRRGRDPARGA